LSEDVLFHHLKAGAGCLEGGNGGHPKVVEEIPEIGGKACGRESTRKFFPSDSTCCAGVPAKLPESAWMAPVSEQRRNFRRISGRNQLVGRVTDIKINGLMAQVTLSIGGQ
jgi:hypothetical protein